MEGDGGIEDDEMVVGMRERSNTWHGSRVNYVEVASHFDTINEKPSDQDISGIKQECMDSTESIKLPQPSSPLVLMPTSSKKNTSRRNAWGSASYADLITEAIESTSDQRMTLVQIYEWMVNNIQYFQQRSDTTSSMGWKNSIRHNLSLHQQFCRVPKEGAGKSSWWVVNKDLLKMKPPRRRATMGEPLLLDKKRQKVNRRMRMPSCSLDSKEEEGEGRRKHRTTSEVDEPTRRSSFSVVIGGNEGIKNIYLQQKSPSQFCGGALEPPNTTASYVVCSSIPIASPTFLLPVNFTQSPLQQPPLDTTLNNNHCTEGAPNNQPIILCVPTNLKGHLFNQLMIPESENQSENNATTCQQQPQQQQIIMQQKQLAILQQSQQQQLISINNKLLNELNTQTHNMTLIDHPSSNIQQLPNNNQQHLSNIQQLTTNNQSTINPPSNITQQQIIYNTQQKQQPNNTFNLPEKRQKLLLDLLHSEKFCQIRRENPALNKRIIDILNKKKQLLNNKTINDNNNNNNNNNNNSNNNNNLFSTLSQQLSLRKSLQTMQQSPRQMPLLPSSPLSSPSSPLSSSISSPLSSSLQQQSLHQQTQHVQQPLSLKPQQYHLKQQQLVKHKTFDASLIHPPTPPSLHPVSPTLDHTSFDDADSYEDNDLSEECKEMEVDKEVQFLNSVAEDQSAPQDLQPFDLDYFIQKQLELDETCNQQNQKNQQQQNQQQQNQQRNLQQQNQQHNQQQQNQQQRNQQLNYINEIISRSEEAVHNENILNNINLNNNNTDLNDNNIVLNNDDNNNKNTNNIPDVNSIKNDNNSNNNNSQNNNSNNKNMLSNNVDDVSLMTSLDESSLLLDGLDIFECFLNDDEEEDNNNDGDDDDDDINNSCNNATTNVNNSNHNNHNNRDDCKLFQPSDNAITEELNHVNNKSYCL